MSIFFLLGTIFIALFGITNMTYLFFSATEQPYYIFPYGIAFGIVAFQFAIFVSRGFELTTNTYNGELILPLKAFGNKAHIFQVSICVTCIVACFIIFCVTAATYGGFTGFSYSLAFGWIVAACLTFIYHVVFAFGFKEITRTSYADGSRVNNAETTIYLFLDVALDNHIKRRPTTEIIAGGVTTIVSFAFGLCFILSGRIGFLCCCIVVHAVLYFGLVFSTFISASSASSSAALSSAFFASVVWLTAVFQLSHHGWGDGWGASVLLSAVIALLFLVVSFATLFGVFKDLWGLWSLRVTWIILASAHLGGIITLFIINYKCGLFITALSIHLLVCVFRANEAINHYGIFCTALGFTVVLLVCCVIGNSNENEIYSDSVSSELLPDYSEQYTSLNVSMFTPLCRSFYSSGVHDVVNVVGAALFAKLGLNMDKDSLLKDLNVWFPQYTMDDVFVTSNGHMKMTVFRSAQEKTTFLSLGSFHSLNAAIKDVTMWIEVYTLSFISLLVPQRVLLTCLPYITFVKDMSPLMWKYSLDELKSYVESVCSNTTMHADDIHIVGHNGMGVVASVLVENSCKAKVTTFSSLASYKTFEKIPEQELPNRMMNVVPEQSYITLWESRPFVQVFPCSNIAECTTLSQIIEDLHSFCPASGQ